MWQKIRLTVIVTAIVFLLSALVMYLFLPTLPTAKLQKNADADWQMNTVNKEDPKIKAEQLVSRTLWKEPAVADAAQVESVPLTAPDWRIAAVIKVGSSNEMVISFNDKPNNLQTLKVGDKLPGGFPILRIEQNWIVISIHGKKSMLAVGQN
jgi:hypothetical protein